MGGSRLISDGGAGRGVRGDRHAHLFPPCAGDLKAGKITEAEAQEIIDHFVVRVHASAHAPRLPTWCT
jgi:hypothetical protein